MTIGWNAVATSLAALSPIGGIIVKDIANIPQDCRMLTPILFPWPDGLIKGIKPQRLTLGHGSLQYQMGYSMTWRYLHSPIGGGVGGIYTDYSNFVTKMDVLYSAILTNADLITGCNTILLPDLPVVGAVFDPAGNYYHGCDLVFQVLVEI